jgi:hypothetical protein
MKQIHTLSRYFSEWVLSFIHLFLRSEAWFIVTGKIVLEQVTAGTATVELAELQVQ